jgi:cytochrome c oxidase subunit IV
MTDGTDLVTISPDDTPATGGAELVAQGDHHPVVADGHSHPGPRQYVLIAVILVILTGIEVATSYADANSNLVIAVLAVMATIKFYLVAAWYMHMKQDNRFFRRAFVGGITLACFVYGIVLFIFSSTVLKS